MYNMTSYPTPLPYRKQEFNLPNLLKKIEKLLAVKGKGIVIVEAISIFFDGAQKACLLRGPELEDKSLGRCLS
ncbi:hypothetical protein PNOK_0459600 [Pyrrhoderma noxium]|uniref:Uncharacterized protein n=1 Tax=Pyrrhoderma noxium TaxID=2282107 RepID=A0A286UJ99_9AGAM|nr:hypothetical protein PNOK_0459600 [Pyrrhoderma noxium]